MEKKSSQAAGPWFSSVLPDMKASVKKPEKESESKPSKKLAIPNNVIIVAGIIIVLVGGFFFFTFVFDKDKLWGFQDNLDQAVSAMSSSNVGTLKEIVIPLPKSVDQVCFNNYNLGSEFGAEVSLQPESLDKFNVANIFVVDTNPLCVNTDGSLKVRMQVLSKDGLTFVGVYLSSINPNVSPFASSTPPASPPVQESEDQTESDNDTTIQNPPPTPEYPPVENPPVEEPPLDLPPDDSGLSDAQIEACNSAADNSDCPGLAQLGIVSPQQCCDAIGMCC